MTNALDGRKIYKQVKSGSLVRLAQRLFSCFILFSELLSETIGIWSFLTQESRFCESDKRIALFSNRERNFYFVALEPIENFFNKTEMFVKIFGNLQAFAERLIKPANKILSEQT